MTATEATAPKNKVTHSPLLTFRKRAHCKQCELRDACLIDKTLEMHCIMALIADSQHNTMRLNATRGPQP